MCQAHVVSHHQSRGLRHAARKMVLLGKYTYEMSKCCTAECKSHKQGTTLQTPSRVMRGGGASSSRACSAWNAPCWSRYQPCNPWKTLCQSSWKALKKAAALWELIFLYFQSAIKLIFLKSISLLMMVSDEWSPSLYLPWAVPPLLSKLSLLRRERERATEWGSGKASQAQPIPYPVKILK